MRIRPEHCKRFKRLCRGLDKLMKEIRKYEPDAAYYNTPGWIHLLVGLSHDDKTGRPIYENAVCDEWVSTLSGGDW
jgi:hypothetical protein